MPFEYYCNFLSATYVNSQGGCISGPMSSCKLPFPCQASSLSQLSLPYVPSLTAHQGQGYPGHRAEQRIFRSIREGKIYDFRNFRPIFFKKKILKREVPLIENWDIRPNSGTLDLISWTNVELIQILRLYCGVRKVLDGPAGPGRPVA